MEEMVIRVIGMHCQGCVDTVHRALSAQAGVRSVAVTLEPGEARVVFDPARVAGQALIEAIEETGFDAEMGV